MKFRLSKIKDCFCARPQNDKQQEILRLSAEWKKNYDLYTQWKDNVSDILDRAENDDDDKLRDNLAVQAKEAFEKATYYSDRMDECAKALKLLGCTEIPQQQD